MSTVDHRKLAGLTQGKPEPSAQVVKPAAAPKPAPTAAEAELETFVSQSAAKASKPGFALASAHSWRIKTKWFTKV